MRKIAALVVAAMMIVLSLSTMAFADGETTTKNIKLSGGKAGHTYTLYQVFTGKVDGEQLTNIQWGTGVTDTFKETKETAAAYAKEVATANDARATAQALITANALTNGTDKALTADGDVEFTGLAEGYYVVVDTNGNQSGKEGDYSSAVIVQVVKDVDIALKGDGATSEKKVKDVNDSVSDSTSGWQDSADYDIGDSVPFQLKATTADNVAAYKKYHITFEDKQSDGLDAPTSYTVTVLGKEFELSASGAAPAAQTTTNGTQISVETVTPDAGQTFAIKVTFTPASGTTLNAECNKTDIVVNYVSTLNTSAKIGKEGNPNDSYIRYSNNPESSDDKEEGTTPDDKVIVFTYKTDIDKVDETGAALKGANFTLYKEVADGTVSGAKKGSELEFAEGVEHSAISADKYYVTVGNRTGDAMGSTFEFKGIDDGVYVLVETTVPTGYNAWKSSVVTVTATHDETSNDPQLTELTSTSPFTANKDAGEIAKKDKTTHSAASGELYAEIENNSGAVLPSTGGIGTTIFYMIGAILVLGAGILLVSKRRMSAN